MSPPARLLPRGAPLASPRPARPAQGRAPGRDAEAVPGDGFAHSTKQVRITFTLGRRAASHRRVHLRVAGVRGARRRGQWPPTALRREGTRGGDTGGCVVPGPAGTARPFQQLTSALLQAEPRTLGGEGEQTGGPFPGELGEVPGQEMDVLGRTGTWAGRRPCRPRTGDRRDTGLTYLEGVMGGAADGTGRRDSSVLIRTSCGSVTRRLGPGGAASAATEARPWGSSRVRLDVLALSNLT